MNFTVQNNINYIKQAKSDGKVEKKGLGIKNYLSGGKPIFNTGKQHILERKNSGQTLVKQISLKNGLYLKPQNNEYQQKQKIKIVNSRIFSINDQLNKNVKSFDFTSEENLAQFAENIESSFSQAQDQCSINSMSTENQLTQPSKINSAIEAQNSSFNKLSNNSTEYCSNKHNFKISNAVNKVNYNSKKDLGIKKFELPKVKINLDIASETQYHTTRENFHYFIKGGEINSKNQNKSQDKEINLIINNNIKYEFNNNDLIKSV